jgi:organic hydroperoxide reductase OsmC/OhrA
VTDRNLRLVAEVEGDIEDMDGVLKITKIRIQYHLKIPSGAREKADQALATYAEKCPGYQTVKDCIECSWDAKIANHEQTLSCC